VARIIAVMDPGPSIPLATAEPTPPGPLPVPSGHALTILLRYWQAIHPPGGGLPGRRDVRPEAITSLLPFVWLMDVRRDPLRFSMRLLGTALGDAGADGTVHVPMDEVHGDAWRPVQQVLESVVATGTPGHRRGPPLLRHGDPRIVALEWLALPLAADGRTVDMILGATVYEWRPGTAPRTHRYGPGI
jgi:hypothetical protein